MSLTLQVYDGVDKGTLLADFTASIIPARGGRGMQFATNKHGHESLSVPLIPMPIDDAFQVYDWPGTPHVVVSDDAGSVVWEGRLEDIAIVPGGVRLGALGYWRALTDVPYTALWSKTGSGGWRALTEADQTNRKPEKFNIDNNNRVFLSLKKNQTYGPSLLGGLVYLLPHNSERDLVEITYTYDVTLPTDWRMTIRSHTEGFGTTSTDRTITGDGTSQTGTETISLAANKQVVSMQVDNNTGGPYTNTNEDHAWYVKLTGIRILTQSTQVLASDIAASLATYVNGINSDQLSSSSALIEATTTDLEDELYEDDLPADILDDLALLHGYEAGVWENQILHFREKNTKNRSWYIDVTGIISLERSIEELRNSAYALYRDAGGRVLRTAVSSTQSSIDRYSLTRRGLVQVQTTNSTQAETHRDTFLSDRDTLAIRADIEFDRIYDSGGTENPLYMIRAGDKVTMRNLPPSAGTSIDNIRTFLVGRTEYDVETNELALEPENPTPSLVTLVARREAGITQ